MLRAFRLSDSESVFRPVADAAMRSALPGACIALLAQVQTAPGIAPFALASLAAAMAAGAPLQ